MPEKLGRIKGGYYIKARCLRDSWIAHSAPVVRETWDYLLREANHKERKYNGHIIKRGQLFRTYGEIRESLNWMVGASRRTYTANQMKHTMKLLSNNAMINLSNQPRGMLITICNYEFYQDPKNYESTTESPSNMPPNHPRINSPSPTINKNVKNDNNEKNKPKTVSDGNKKMEPFQEDFDIVWPHYPRKDEKENAFKAYQARRRIGTAVDLLYRATVNYAKSAKGKEKRFIKMGKTFYGPGNVWRDFLKGNVQGVAGNGKGFDLDHEKSMLFDALAHDLETDNPNMSISPEAYDTFCKKLEAVTTVEELEQFKIEYGAVA